MKRIIKLFLIVLLLFLSITIKAKSVNYSSSIVDGNNYIKLAKYNDRNKYLILDQIPKFVLSDDGKLSINNSFVNGGFLNKSEYCLSTESIDCKKNTYLMIPSSYWTLTQNGTSRYYISNSSGLSVQSDSDKSNVRVTEFVRPIVTVSGSGKFSDPWVFNNNYFVLLKTNKKNYAYFGSESEKKSSEEKYATTNCLKGSGNCANFDITVERGYGNNPVDGCNLTFIKNGEKKGSAVVKTYEISNIKNDVNCLAIFDDDRFTIKFDSNGGTGTMESKIARYGHKISLPNYFTKKYHEFVGWNTKADGSGDSWSSNEFKFDSVAGEKGIDEFNNLTLYAQWKLTAFEVTFNPNGGEIKDDITSKSILFGKEYGYMPTPIRDRYIFDGWFTKKEKGEEITVGKAMLTPENHTLYAHWHSIDLKMEFDYTGNYQEFVTPYEGYYTVELWGADGGASRSFGQMGRGGYTRGSIYLKEGEKLYVYVGGRGSAVYGESDGGWNGGGGMRIGGSGGMNPGGGGTGGGATDIRYFGEEEPNESDLVWSSYLGLNSRIMVAGGAGGGSYECCRRSAGSAGGSGGSINNPTGSFGIGYGAWGWRDYRWPFMCGAGGGGYYGGNNGSGNWAGNFSAGGGGSSYISGYGACKSIKAADDRTLTNNPVHYSGKKFVDGYFEQGASHRGGVAKGGGSVYSGYAKFTYEGLTHGSGEPSWNTPGYFEFEVPKTGTYKIELWGASGGSSRSGAGAAKGGYVSGEIKLTEKELLYVYVGGAGTSVTDVITAFGGYNGGGNVNISSVGTNGEGSGGGTGGGASDIRLISGAWDDKESLESRIMVAGGAGGASYECCKQSYGYSGGDGGSNPSSKVLGAGGNSGIMYSGGNPAMQGAGGGGFYGGKAGSSWNEAGSGGSSYVSGAEGFETHSSGKKFTNVTITRGVNSGNGKAIITFIK